MDERMNERMNGWMDGKLNVSDKGVPGPRKLSEPGSPNLKEVTSFLLLVFSCNKSALGPF